MSYEKEIEAEVKRITSQVRTAFQTNLINEARKDEAHLRLMDYYDGVDKRWEQDIERLKRLDAQNEEYQKTTLAACEDQRKQLTRLADAFEVVAREIVKLTKKET